MVGLVARSAVTLLVTLTAMAVLVFFITAAGPVARSEATQIDVMRWIAGALTGDFGPSASMGQPVGTLIAERLGVTVPLATLAALFAGGLASLMVVRLPSASRVFQFATIAINTLPSFWVGMLLSLIFAMLLRWLPQGGFIPWRSNPMGALESLLLPALALALPRSAMLASVVSRELARLQAYPFVQQALAKGLTEGEAFRRHGFRNLAVRLIPPIGIEVAHLFAATMAVETVFYLPGLGGLLLSGALAGDVALVRGGSFVLLALMSVVLFAAQVCRGWADTRIRGWRLQ